MNTIKRVKKKKLNLKRTLVFILIIYILFCFIYYIFNRPIRHIEISGNNLVSDATILRISKLKDYPSILKYSNYYIKKKIKSIELIDDVKVKKSIFLNIYIKIKENRVLFYYKNIDKIVLSNGSIVKNNYNVVGIPIFTNEISSDLLPKFISNFNKINDNIIYEINEISYYPLIVDDNIIEKDRFKILMNDGNTVILNTKSLSVINKYNDIYASLDGKLGTINLDTNKVSNLVFIPYEEETIIENEE